MCVLFASLLGAILTPGADAGSQYFVMARKMSPSHGVSVSLFICFIGALIATTIGLPLVSRDIIFFQKAESESFYAALVLIPLMTFSSAIQHQLVGLRKFKQIAVFSLLQTAVNCISLVVFVIWCELGVSGAVLALCAGNLSMIIACARSLRRDALLGLEVPSLRNIKRVLRYGRRYYVARIGWGVDSRIGILILSVIAGRSEIGLFAVASGLMACFLVIPNSVVVPLLPRAAAGKEGRAELVQFCARVTTWLTGGAMALLSVVDVQLVNLLFSTEFATVVILIRTIAPGMLVYAGGSIFAAYFRGINRPDVCSWSVGVGLFVNASLTVVLFPVMGVTSAAVGMTLGLVARALVLVVNFCRITQRSPLYCWFPKRGDLHVFRDMVRLGLVRSLRRRR